MKKKTETQKSLKNLVRLAKSYLEPDTTTVEGLKTLLQTWFVLNFNTTYKDPVLLSHTFEELIVLYYVHNLHKDSTFADSILGVETEDEQFEKWLQKRMGDDYISEDQMVEDVVQYEEREREIAAKLPDRIETDFSMLGIEDD